MKFSIIIPVFNAQDYLIECLDSVFNQDFNCNIEVIAVDDCSTDSSYSLLESYRKKDSRLNILQNNINMGQTHTRVIGMNKASGDYIMHLDADDWFISNSIQYIHEKCHLHNPDILIFDYLTDKDGIKNIKYKINSEAFVLKNKFNIHKKYFFGNSATKVVKRNLIKSMITGSEKIKTTGDDLLYCTEVFLRANSFLIIPKIFYGARLHDNSLTKKSSPKLMLQYIYNLFDHLIRILTQNNANKIICDNLLKYVENGIYLTLLKCQMFTDEKIKFQKLYVNKLTDYPYVKSDFLRSLNLSFNSVSHLILKSKIKNGLKITIKTLLYGFYLNIIKDSKFRK